MAAISANYVFGGEQNELQRLLAQAEDLKPETCWLLDELDIKPGWRAADIGCGPIGILDELSLRVGREGAVAGIEREPRFAAMARAEVARRGLSNVSIVEGDTLEAPLAWGTYDLVHERLVLINVPPDNQLALVSTMFRLAKPGGTLILQSWDRASHVCYPEHPSWRILDEAYRSAVRATNGDGTTGRMLPSLLKAAGITGIRTKVHVRAAEPGDPRRTHRLRILDVARQRILASGLLSEADFDAHRSALAQHLADPDTLLIDQLFVQAWGTKPL